MKRAVISDGNVEWHETCFCSPPLRHERATVYDQFFLNIETKPISAGVRLEGERFWDYLRKKSQRHDPSIGSGGSPSRIRYVPLRIL